MAILKAQGISKRFGKKQVLTDVSYTFSPGITALLGPNGAGKSTLMNILCTLLQADSGCVCYDGTDVLAMKKAYLQKLSVQFQTQPMYRSDNAMEYLRRYIQQMATNPPYSSDCSQGSRYYDEDLAQELRIALSQSLPSVRMALLKNHFSKRLM